MTLLYSEFAKKSKLVTLTPEQLETAASVAAKRNSSHRSADRADGLVRGGSLEVDVMGAQAELAVCVALGLSWENAFVPLGEWDARRRELLDVGPYEVKSTARPNGCLLIQKQFADEPAYILVTTERCPVFRLAGWLYGHEVKQPKYWRTDVPRPCYMAPQSALRGMDSLW